MGSAATGDGIDPDFINASRTPVTLLDGASLCEHTVSFAVMRGGHNVTPNGFVVRAVIENMDEAQLQEKTAAPLQFPEQLKTIRIDQDAVPALIHQIDETTM